MRKISLLILAIFCLIFVKPGFAVESKLDRSFFANLKLEQDFSRNLHRQPQLLPYEFLFAETIYAPTPEVLKKLESGLVPDKRMSADSYSTFSAFPVELDGVKLYETSNTIGKTHQHISYLISLNEKKGVYSILFAYRPDPGFKLQVRFSESKKWMMIYHDSLEPMFNKSHKSALFSQSIAFFKVIPEGRFVKFNSVISRLYSMIEADFNTLLGSKVQTMHLRNLEIKDETIGLMLYADILDKNLDRIMSVSYPIEVNKDFEELKVELAVLDYSMHRLPSTNLLVLSDLTVKIIDADYACCSWFQYIKDYLMFNRDFLKIKVINNDRDLPAKVHTAIQNANRLGKKLRMKAWLRWTAFPQGADQPGFYIFYLSGVEQMLLTDRL